MPTVAPGSRIASPLLARSSPAMIFSRVDLPVPLGPTTPILAPCRNDRVTLSRTTLSPCALRTFRRVKTYSAMTRKPTVVPVSLAHQGPPVDVVLSRRRRDRLLGARIGRRSRGGDARGVLLRVARELAHAEAQVVSDEGRLDLHG